MHQYKSLGIIVTGLIVGLSHGLHSILGVLTIRLITELVRPELFGITNLILSLTLLGTQIFLGPTSNTVIRFQTHSLDSDKFLASALRNSIKNAGFLSVLAVFLILISKIDKTPSSLTIATACVTLIYSQAIRNVIIAKIHAEANRLLYAAYQLLESGLTLVFSCVLLTFYPSVFSIIFGQATGIITSLYILKSRFPEGFLGTWREKSCSEFSNSLSSYGVAFAWLSVVNWGSNMADRFVLTWISGPAVAGTYIASFAIASRAITLCNSITTDIFRPQVFAGATRDGSAIGKDPIIRWIFCNVILCCATLFLMIYLSDTLFYYLFAEGYRQGAEKIVIWIGLGYLIYGINQVLEVCVMALNRPYKLLLPMLLGTLAGAGGSFILIPYGGAEGAAIASMIGFLVQMIVTGIQLYLFRISSRKTVLSI